MPKHVQQRHDNLMADADKWEERIEEFMDAHWDGHNLIIREFGDLGTEIPNVLIRNELTGRYLEVGFQLDFIGKNMLEQIPKPYISVIKLQGKSVISKDGK